MDLQTCLKKLQYVGVLAFATVDGAGAPQVRNISAIHYEPDGLYFFTARGKDFCRELPRYKRPRRVIFAKVPRNPTGKIEKPVLRQIYCGGRLVEEQTRA